MTGEPARVFNKLVASKGVPVRDMPRGRFPTPSVRELFFPDPPAHALQAGIDFERTGLFKEGAGAGAPSGCNFALSARDLFFGARAGHPGAGKGAGAVPIHGLEKGALGGPGGWRGWRIKSGFNPPPPDLIRHPQIEKVMIIKVSGAKHLIRLWV